MSAPRKNRLLLALLLALGLMLLLQLTLTQRRWKSSDSKTGSDSSAGFVDWLEAREKAADEGIWNQEILAQKCGRTFESLWDSVNRATNKLAALAGFPVGEILLGDWQSPKALPHGIEVREVVQTGRTVTMDQWRHWVQKFASDGWQLENLEFRHNRFEPDEQGEPKRSHFYFAARLNHTALQGRAVVEGNLIVDWATKPADAEFQPVKRIDASGLSVKTRFGEPLFQLILHDSQTPPERSTYIDPLMVHDFDVDGVPEIILAGKNLVYRRHGQDRYVTETLCRHPLESLTSAVVGDFDGDGVADLLGANSRGLTFFQGSSKGTFDQPGRLAWPANPTLKNTMVLTCGDLDQDGDLDVFLGQYRVPTLGQVLRPYYYNANDGWPSYLLLNDGRADFKDVTESAGLGAKRWRRVYSASLADLDADGRLDLVVVSDFAGLDLYRNEGNGRFSDVTRQWIAEPRGFGMAHALADFNVDGRLDLLMIGMPSATVDRLEHLGLRRAYSADDPRNRPAMSHGNRLYLAQPEGRLEQTTLSESLARSGWSWGCGVADFDNDGFPDVYIANGLESKQSVQEYEPEFWLHDIFVDESTDDVTATRYFMEKFSRTRGQGWSYGGYEKNRLYLNQRGESFVEMGHLAGVALEPDCRNVAASDLDGDGRVDLLVTTLEVWPLPKQTLRIYRNGLGAPGHWIGFQFRDAGKGESPVGVQVTIHTQGNSQIRQLVTGDSHRSQHASTLHFGLGKLDRVDRAEIRWVNGTTLTVQHPTLDQYHSIQAPPPK